MKLEDQVCSLELSQRLKGLGVKQNSLFWHKTNVGNGNIKLIHAIGLNGSEDDETCSAFTVAELGEMLPSYLSPETSSRKEAILDTCKNNQNKWLIAYSTNENVPPRIMFIEDTEANARAKMLIYLLENKLLTLEK